MSDRRIHRSAGGTYYKAGSWNTWCQRCGKKFKSEQLQEEWDGLKVCKKCFELRHPQDMVRGIVDLQAVPWASPELADTFVINAVTQGFTTAPFSAGPENLYDYSNVLSVRITGNPLASVAELDVLNGANLCAVQTPTGLWEALQFTTASLIAPFQYTLSQLLRGRAGTETAMTSAPLPINSPFVFIGQSNQANYDWMRLYLNINAIPYSPCDFTCYEDNGDVVIQWIRRSRIPNLDQDNWATPFLFNAPLDCPDEAYEVDILNANGSVIRTLHAVGGSSVVYPAAMILADFGIIQTVLSIIGYQVDTTPGQGRGFGRPATLSIITSTANDTLGDQFGNYLCDQSGNVLGA